MKDLIEQRMREEYPTADAKTRLLMRILAKDYGIDLEKNV